MQLGYARVSTDEQNTRDALTRASCERIDEEKRLRLEKKVLQESDDDRTR